MRAHFGLFMLLASCGGQSDRDTASSKDSAGGPRRVSSESEGPEIEFLQYLIEHEWTIGALLRSADERELTDSGKAALKHAEKHWFDNEADLVAARQGYGGGRGSPAPGPRETGERLNQFKGARYEGALLGKLVGHYKEEVASIDTALPRLRAEHVRTLAQRIRAQRLEDIRELTQK